MGFFQNLVSGLSDAANKGQDSTELALVFQSNERFARLAMLQLQKAAARRNIEVDEDFILNAHAALRINPRMTFGEFLDSFL